MIYRLIARLRASEIQVSAPDKYPNGRFARLADPEGDQIELWEPNPEE
ncbi:MAG: putative enzyme related to lactoylglutathione lyase [Candidatus Azotimanducaceae bacterium]